MNHSKIFYDPPPRVMEIKAKINKWDLSKLKNFCTNKETMSKVKRQPSEWEKIIVNEATDKELISKIYKQLMQLNSRKINDPIQKWAKELNRQFSTVSVPVFILTNSVRVFPFLHTLSSIYCLWTFGSQPF